MFSPEEHPFYDLILRMVMWGERKEDVLNRLKTNGIVGDEAMHLYQHAYQERIRFIRTEQAKKAAIGGGTIAAAVAAFCVCWFGLGLIPRLLLYACFAAVGVGLWKLINGLAGCLMAHHKMGDVNEDF